MKHLKPSITSARILCEGFHELTFSWDPSAGIPLPGQFMTIRVAEGTAPLLRRPFAFSGYDTKAGTASIIFQKRGTATQLLAGKEPGDKLDIIGPLGNTFSMPALGQDAVILAGGIGLGPLLFLVSSLVAQKRTTTFIFGARSKSMVPACVLSGITASICTDDGSMGFKGTVIDYLRTLSVANARLYACGPGPMLKACHAFALEHQLACEVSVEQVMACGVGACMGCVVKVVREPGYARACKDGPVFDSRELVWE
jgi:dihydroorotate dehydrogenase electron transfer subunit